MSKTGKWYVASLVGVFVVAYVIFEFTYDPTHRERCEYLVERIIHVKRYGPGSAEGEKVHLEDRLEFARRDCNGVLSRPK